MNNATPEWVILIAPFISGAAGVGLTAGVAWGVIKQKYIDLERRMGIAETKLETQVGQVRCDKMRDECKIAVSHVMDQLKKDYEEERKWQRTQFTEIAKFMGRFEVLVEKKDGE
jgi:hypothetical protein